jgi:two-component system, LytTR family, sensor kinase
MPTPDLRVAPIRWRWIAAIWLAGALFDASQTLLIMHAEGRVHPWLPLFGTELLSWLPWMLATPFIIRLAHRYSLILGAHLRPVTVHLAAFVVVSVVTEAWSATLQMLFNPWEHHRSPTFWDTWSTTLIYQVLTFLIAYVLILTVTYLLDAREGAARQRTEAARLSEELSKAQLAALRRQMEPHFVYNALHSISGLVRNDRKDAAVSMIVGLSEFLRRASEDSHRSLVPLAEEADYLQRYLEIQKARFGDRLRVSVDIPDELLRAEVPNLLLQPLVENSIKHGIEQRIVGGTVRVAAVRLDGTLRLTVSNDGPTLPRDWEAARIGVGIGNLRTRLEILYGDGFDLQLRPVETGGADVVVTLPIRGL